MNKSKILGVFDDEEKLVSSVRGIQQKGIRINDVITPYPIHELFDLLRLKSRLPMAAFIYGVFAFIITSVPAYHGYYASGGALEVGRSSTRAVVFSSILILLFNVLLTQLLLA